MKHNGTVPKPWHVYLIECTDGSYYTGITTDVEARYRKHAEGKGARYTRARRPRRLIGTCAMPDRSAASKAEWSIKQTPRHQKLQRLLSLQRQDAV